MRIVETPKSSNIEKIGYENESLYVTFKGGSVYRYDKVPEKLFESFALATDNPSAGKWLISQVKNKYPYTRLY